LQLKREPLETELPNGWQHVLKPDGGSKKSRFRETNRAVYKPPASWDGNEMAKSIRTPSPI